MFIFALSNPHHIIISLLILIPIILFGCRATSSAVPFGPRRSRIVQNPLNIDEIRLNILQHLPRSDLTNISTVSKVFYSSARELLELRLQLRHVDRQNIWELISKKGTTPEITPRYTSAIIDLALNPGEVLSALLLTPTAAIKVVEFTSSACNRVEWALTLTQHMLSAIVIHLPGAHHFVLYEMSLRFQFTLLHAAHRQITTLELHNTNLWSYGYTMRQVSLETLHTLHLFSNISPSLDFLLRVVMFIDAPFLTTLTIGNCLSGNPLAIHDTVKAFSRKLTRLHLLNETGPTGEYFQDNRTSGAFIIISLPS
ncbi:hypothetical protein AAF712_015547 [Marasmius tenuissimus]|uniref:F-box domain-containing protein n=1 Tax=Marasmius tenuissimus TaxID=585030 RepID=A0ABR2Z9Z6_9AGAR